MDPENDDKQSRTYLPEPELGLVVGAGEQPVTPTLTTNKDTRRIDAISFFTMTILSA